MTKRYVIAFLLKLFSIILIFAICMVAPEQEIRITAYISAIFLIISERIDDR